ncbi:MAG TPA: molybdate ABC transporter substrate-binding protein [Rhizomicrobium sp.]|nr:molybdate ABC transporter substrate-binding protein [Rhizomicrobium sp.]
MGTLKGLLASAVLVGLAAMGACAAASTPAADSGTITVFAAASLTDALTQAGKVYEARTGRHVTFSFAASSTLAHQIESSGGVDMFLSADRDWMEYLDARGLMNHASIRTLLGNRLVLIAPRDSAAHVALGPHADLSGALGGGRLAIADPDSVPAGRYARQALTSLGAWNAVAGRLAVAENVRAALAFVARGETPLGIVYATDAAVEPRVKIVGVFPGNSHLPIVYPVGLTRDARTGAAAFEAFLESGTAAAIFRTYGFEIAR